MSTETKAEVNTKIEPKRLPTRAEVPVELTWDLSVVYADESGWENDFARIEERQSSFAGMQGALAESPQNLLRCLQLRDEVSTLYSQLRAYASLRRSEDNGNPQAQAMVDRATMLGTRLASATAFIEPEILSIPSSTLHDFVEQEPGLQLYNYYFETLERRRPHVRSAEVEDVLAQTGEAMHTTGTVFRFFNNADLKFPPIRDENGVEVELTHGRYLSFLESRDRRVREDAFRTMHGEYSRWRNTLAASLSGAVK
ncbi:MAG: oligoendopeptidase F, partial [Armatimonadota bacterium]|nr:oligoendopeptidase F [Armatimonadota bacterium]